jgi:hypothetical protein
MDTSLREVIGSCFNKSGSESNYTHFQFYDPRQSLSLIDSKCGNFWQQYCRLVIENPPEKYSRDGSVDLNIGERPQSKNPIIISMNFEFTRNDALMEYCNEDFILELVHSAQYVIETNFRLNVDRNELFCCFLEPSYSNVVMETVQVQIRLHFPFCNIDSNIYKRTYLPLFINYLRERNSFRLLDNQPLNDWDSIINFNVFDSPFPMYGSTDKNGQPPLALQNIYGVIDDKGNGDIIDFEEIFTFSCHSDVLANLLPPDFYDNNYDPENCPDFGLPIFFSLRYWNQVTILNDNGNNTVSTPTASRPNSAFSIVRSDNNTEQNTQLEIADAMISMLSEKRVEEENYWLEVGQALYNCDGGSDLALRMWIRFSQRTQKWSSEDCRAHWGTFQKCDFVQVSTESIPTPFTVKTLAWYAKEDSPDEYKKWHREWCMVAMNKASSCLDVDVAEAVYRLYWLSYARVSTGAQEKSWRCFKNHRWTSGDAAHQSLITNVMNNVRDQFRQHRALLSKRCAESDDDDF